MLAAHSNPAAVSGIIRRFCSCDFVRSCSCGEPRPRSGWTAAELTDLRKLMREHGSMARVASLMSRTQRDCNRALFALIGRTPEHALAALEAKAAR